jgi:hypothetical protein
MQIPGPSAFWSSSFQKSLQIQTTRKSLPIPRVEPAAAHPRRFAQHIADLSQALRSLGNSSGSRKVSLHGATHLAVAGMVAGSDLGLQLQPTAASLASTQEVNAIATSFGPFQPEFSGSSTATPTIGGVYNGSSGDDTLTFDVRRGGTVGSNSLRIRIENGSGQTLEEINISASYTPGEAIELDNGLTLKLSSGNLVKNNTFELAVFTSVGSAVDPTKAFDGTGNDIPNFEPGVGVQAGSFTVNGAQIDVLASDSIQSVLAKINASGAGVSATFDTLTERVVLIDEEPGASGTITLGADDSGFLDAVKLSAAALTPGTDEDMIRALDQVSEIAVQSGTFKINGVILSVDTQSDSLHDLIERINAADTGVTASFDLESGRVKLSSSTYFDLEDGTSGLFGSLGIEEGRYGEELVSAGLKKLRFSNSRSLRRDLRKVSNAVQDLLASPALSGRTLESELVRNALSGALRSAIGELKPDAAGDHLSTGLGITFDFRANGEAKVSIDQGQLSHALNKRASDLAQFLMGSSGPGGGEGLIALLSKAVESIEESVFPLFDPGGEGGLFVDYLA